MLDVLPYAALAAMVMVATYFLTTFTENVYMLLASRISIAALLYMGVAYIVRSEELREIIDFLFRRKKRQEV